MEATKSSKAIGEEVFDINRLCPNDSGSSCGYCNEKESFSWGLISIYLIKLKFLQVKIL